MIKRVGSLVVRLGSFSYFEANGKWIFNKGEMSF